MPCFEVRHARAIVALADLAEAGGGFIDAAVHLGVSQPALSRTISQAERLLDVAVFERSSRYVRVLPQGARVVSMCRLIIRQVDELTGVSPAVIRLGFSWLLPNQLAPRVFAEFDSEHDVTTQPVRCDAPLEALRTGAVDVAVVRRPVDGEDVATIHVADEVRVIATARDARLPSTTRWDDLGREPLVVNVKSGSTQPEDWLCPADRSIVRCSNFDEWIELIAAGRGIGAISELAMTRAAHPGVAYHRIDDAPPSPIWIVVRKDCGAQIAAFAAQFR